MPFTRFLKCLRKHSPPGSSTRRGKLSVERLEERSLLDGMPVQFGSADAFKQFLIDTALAQYKDLFGQSFSYYYQPYPVDRGVPQAFTLNVNDAAAAASNPSSFS